MTTNEVRRGKTILIGASEAGKTTLIQTLSRQGGTAAKTMTVEHRFDFIDTPGEYIEHRSFYKALIVTAADADRIGLVLACGCDDCWIPPAFAASFAKPVFGVVTKADRARQRSVWEAAREPLRRAGADPVFVLSAWSGQGLADLAAYLGLPAPDGRALPTGPAGELSPAGRVGELSLAGPAGAAARSTAGLSPDPPILDYRATPSGRAGGADDAQRTSSPPSRRRHRHHTRLMPLATPIIGGSGLRGGDDG